MPWKDWKPFAGANYLIYDSHRDAPTGFAIRVGKRASVYLVEKLVAGKNMKSKGKSAKQAQDLHVVRP